MTNQTCKIPLTVEEACKRYRPLTKPQLVIKAATFSCLCAEKDNLLIFSKHKEFNLKNDINQLKSTIRIMYGLTFCAAIVVGIVVKKLISSGGTLI